MGMLLSRIPSRDKEDTHGGHPLPPEILREIFLQAASNDLPTAMMLSLVCRTSNYWLLPEMYGTVYLTSVHKIKAFGATLLDDQRYGGHNRRHVRNLWIGPDNTTHKHGLCYGGIEWPHLVIHNILRLCTSLRALAITNLDQYSWLRLSDAVPASLESLALGPVHGPIDPARLPRLRRITSTNTTLLADEIRGCRVLTRFFSGPGPNVRWAFRQLPSGALEQMRIVVCCEEGQEARFGELMEDAKEECGEALEDRRVEVSRRALVHRDWLMTLRREWEEAECSAGA